MSYESLPNTETQERPPCFQHASLAEINEVSKEFPTSSIFIIFDEDARKLPQRIHLKRFLVRIKFNDNVEET